MKRLVIWALLFLVVSGYGCVQPSPEVTEADDVEEFEDVNESVEESIEDSQPVEENLEEEESVEEETFDIFNPTLTYSGAYNGPLYGTSEQVGAASMDSYFKNLDRNGINFFIGMFAIFGEPSEDTLVSNDGLGLVIDAAQRHPHRVIPFFNPGIGGEEVELFLGDTMTGWYTDTLTASQDIAGDDFIQGFGEIETQEWSVGHDHEDIQALVTLAQKNDLHFMFHPVASKIDDVEQLLKAYPGVTFLIHMYREDLADSKDDLIRLLQEYDNLYFSMDAAHIIHVNGMDIIYDYDSTNKASSISQFVAEVDREEDAIIQSAIASYKPLVDAAPDKIMWGTEIGPEYAFDKEVFDRAVKISRFVIAGFDEEDQEAVAYKNALRVFGEGVVVDDNIEVINTRSWPECADVQLGSCDETCEGDSGETAEFSPDVEDCLIRCLIPQQCIEIPEMDIG